MAPILAFEIYDIMVKTIAAADPEYYPWRRWSFIYSLSKLNINRYYFDSKLGPMAEIINEEPPYIKVAENEKTEYRDKITKLANKKIKEAYDRFSAKKEMEALLKKKT